MRRWLATSTSFALFPRRRTRDELESTPCSAGHTACYVSPYGDVFPCVQFPLPTGNVRQQRFVDIWRHSDQMNEVRSIRLKDLTTCTSCTPRFELYALPWAGLHGRQHARAVDAGLREVLCQNRSALGQHAFQETRGSQPGAAELGAAESGADSSAARVCQHIRDWRDCVISARFHRSDRNHAGD